MSLFRVWEQLVDCICRPPRDDYSEEDLKGGRRGVFAIGARKFKVSSRVKRDLRRTVLRAWAAPPCPRGRGKVRSTRERGHQPSLSPVTLCPRSAWTSSSRTFAMSA